MSTRSEDRSGFEVLGLSHGFLTDAARLGLTPTALQRLRENKTLMVEFVGLATRAEREHAKKVAERELERERAVTIGEKHYHLVLIPLQHLRDWSCTPQDFVSDAVAHERDKGKLPLTEEAYKNAEMVIRSVRTRGIWIAWTSYEGIVIWERTADGVKSIGSFGTGEGTRFDHFYRCLGMVFMHECPDCDHLPQR